MRNPPAHLAAVGALGLVLALAGCGAAAECRKDYPNFDSAAFQACMRPVLQRENAEANHRASDELRLGR